MSKHSQFCFKEGTLTSPTRRALNLKKDDKSWVRGKHPRSRASGRRMQFRNQVKTQEASKDAEINALTLRCWNV